MDATTSTVAEVAAPAYGLTRPYQRRAAIEAAIRALPFAPADLESILAATPAPEILIHGIRRLRALGAYPAAERVTTQLLERLTPLLQQMVGEVVTNRSDREEVVQVVTVQLWQDIYAPTPANEFLEVYCAHVLKARCRTAAQAIWTRQSHERCFAPQTEDQSAELERLPTPATLDVAECLADAELLRTACDQLTGVVQQAFRLKLAGYPVTSSDPTITTIVGLLGKCERTIRNYLQQAAAILAAWWTREQTALAQDLIPPEPVIAPTASLGVVAAAPVPTLEAPPLPAPPPAPCPRPPRRPWTPRLPQWAGTLVGGLAALGTRLHRKLIAVGRQWVATSPALRATPPALGGSARAAPPGAGAAQYQGHQGSPLERAGPRGRPGAVPLGESCCAVRGSPPAAAHQRRVRGADLQFQRPGFSTHSGPT